MNWLKVVRSSPMVIVLAILAAATMLFISEGSYRRSVTTLDQLVSDTEARASILDLRKNILDAETGQRGYLLTGRVEYLAPYDRAIGPINDLFRMLDTHYLDNARAKPLIDRLREMVGARLSLISETIRLKQEGKPDLAAELVLTGFEKEKMDEIQALGVDLLNMGTLSVAESRHEIDGALSVGRFGVIGLTSICLIALYLYLRHAAQAKAEQHELQNTIRAERDQLEIVVARRTAVLTQLTQHLQTAREDERHRLARNLHDELGSLLTSAKLDAARIKSRLAGAQPEALERLAHLVETLNASIALGRSIIEDLRPSTLANLGLVAAIETLVRDFAARANVEAHCDLTAVKLRPSADLVVYRLVQEALTNISKYAEAAHVWVTIAGVAGQAKVAVRDDGVGFDPDALSGSTNGLVSMRFRVEAEHGELRVVSARGRGTTIEATLPAAT